jgi:hypothetical protein
MAGPRFLSVGFMVKLLLLFSILSVCCCGIVRLFKLSLDVLVTCVRWAVVRAFSNSVILFSIFEGAGGGSQCLFFYVDLLVVFHIVCNIILLVKGDVLQPLGLWGLYKSYSSWEKRVHNQRNKALSWYCNLPENWQGILWTFPYFVLY